MTVLSQYPYPTVSASNGHIETYKEFSPTHVVPTETRISEIQNLLNRITSDPKFDPNLKFDPLKHIIFKPDYYDKTKTFTLKDLQIFKTHVPKVTDFGAAFPFPLLSNEAVNMLLYEALQPEVIDKFARLPNLATNATRLDFHVGGHANTHGRFTKGVVDSPEIAEIVSKFFGTPMSVIYNSETAHLNVSLATLNPEEILKYPQSEEEINEKLAQQDAGDGDAIPSTLGLHYDSTTVALVIMLDLPEDAVGGQTTIVTGDERVVRVPEPKVGYATLIQGRVLKHLASKPVTNHNRITLVNGYAVSGPELLDNTALTSTKPSVLPRCRFDLFYRDWVDYKFTHLIDHLEYIKQEVINDYEQGNGFDQESFVSKCMNIEHYVKKCYDEMECVNNPPYPAAHFKTPYNELT
jgi:hypothetical protein